MDTMVHNAHFMPARRGTEPMVSVRDDRGAEVTELALPETVTTPDQAEEELRAAGWARSAQWSTTDDGWTAPVVAV
ncbi:hypothetical protein A8924_3674 [Saccharopolyspora erythraea NRRL 2338]|nr:hypothetical protein A8924_3674 [Saccharopolyspora erythraea NRRL 2338]